MYFPRNGVAPFKSHRCPQALLGRLPQVSFHTVSDLEANYLVHHSENGFFSLLLPVSVPAILWKGTCFPRDEKWTGVKPESKHCDFLYPTNVQEYLVREIIFLEKLVHPIPGVL